MRDWPVPILMYHRIGRMRRDSSVPGHYVSPALFRAQLRLLRLLGWRAVTLSEVVSTHAADRPMPPKSFVLTFDDGFQNYRTHALPVLEGLGWPATVFLVSALVGQTNRWNEVEGDVVEPLLTWDEVREAEAKGTEFGSHTLTHADLSAVPAEVALAEISQSKAEIEARLGHPIAHFCYPYGRYAPVVPKLVEEAGYASACSCLKGAATRMTDPFLLPRINVRSDTRLAILMLKLARAVRFGR